MNPSRALVILMVPLFLSLGACDFHSRGQDVPLLATISSSQPSGSLVAPATVDFDSRDSRGRITSREWRIDGRAVASTDTLTQHFSTPGIYDIALTIYDADGKSNSDQITYRVLSLAEQFGADHAIAPDEFSGYSFDVNPEGGWGFRFKHAAPWLGIEPEFGSGDPVTVTFYVDPSRLPTDRSTPKAYLEYFDDDGVREVAVVALLPELAPPPIVAIPNARPGATSSTRFSLRNTGSHQVHVELSLEPRVMGGVILSLATDSAVITPTGHPILFELTASCPAFETTFSGHLRITTDDPRGLDHVVPVEIDCREVPAQEFQIELVFKEGDFTPIQIQMMEAAARRLEQIVVGDIPGSEELHPQSHENCLKVISRGPDDYLAPELESIGQVDDLLVYVLKTTEGMVGNTLARGGPCFFRDLSRLPNHGMVMINPALLNEMTELDYLTDTMIHELGHVLGVGTLWRAWDMISPSVSECSYGSTAALTFAGPLATAEFLGLGGAGAPPVTEECAHWHHETFQHEVMSPVITITPDGVHSPVSVMTIASFADLGYVVDYSVADAYVLPSAYQLHSLSHGERRQHGAPVIEIVAK